MRRLQFDVLIIGGGFSGTMLAVHVLRNASTSLSVAIIDRGTLPGRGLAYSSPHRFHLLNVPAGEMSAWPDAPDDFLFWARKNYDPSVQSRSFPPRSVYGAYVASLLEDTLADCARDRFQWIRDEALSLHRRKGKLAVQLKTGPEVSARAVVLATGNFPPANLIFLYLYYYDRHYLIRSANEGPLGPVKASSGGIMVAIIVPLYSTMRSDPSASALHPT